MVRREGKGECAQKHNTLYSRVGLILEFSVPGQIPDSGHVYKAYGMKNSVVG